MRRQGWRSVAWYFWLGPQFCPQSRPASPMRRQGWRSVAWYPRLGYRFGPQAGVTHAQADDVTAASITNLLIRTRYFPLRIFFHISKDGGNSGKIFKNTRHIVIFEMSTANPGRTARPVLSPSSNAKISSRLASDIGTSVQLGVREDSYTLAQAGVTHALAGNVTGANIIDPLISTRYFLLRIFFHISKGGGNSCKIFKNTWHIVISAASTVKPGRTGAETGKQLLHRSQLPCSCLSLLWGTSLSIKIGFWYNWTLENCLLGGRKNQENSKTERGVKVHSVDPRDRNG